MYVRGLSQVCEKGNGEHCVCVSVRETEAGLEVKSIVQQTSFDSVYHQPTILCFGTGKTVK